MVNTLSATRSLSAYYVPHPFSLEELMLKLKLQYFVHLMWREKDPDAGKYWRQKEKGAAEDEMVR